MEETLPVIGEFAAHSSAGATGPDPAASSAGAAGGQTATSAGGQTGPSLSPLPAIPASDLNLYGAYLARVPQSELATALLLRNIHPGGAAAAREYQLHGLLQHWRSRCTTLPLFTPLGMPPAELLYPPYSTPPDLLLGSWHSFVLDEHSALQKATRAALASPCLIAAIGLVKIDSIL
jgi:hypothetical protein